MSNKQKGMLCIILSAFFFAMMSLFVKLSGPTIPSIQKSFFRNFVAMIIAGAMLIKNKEGFHIQKKDLGLLILRASFGTIGILANFYAVDHLLLADASILQKMSPIFVLLFSYLILKEKIKPRQLLFIIGSFIGALFVVKPSFQNHSLSASIIALIGAAAAGVAYTLVRLLTNRGVKKTYIVFFFSSFSCLVVVPYLLFNFVPMDSTSLVYLILAGIMAAGGQFAITNAYSYAPANEISIFDYSQIIFSALAGFFVFHQIPDALSIIGYLLIISMAIINFLYN